MGLGPGHKTINSFIWIVWASFVIDKLTFISKSSWSPPSRVWETTYKGISGRTSSWTLRCRHQGYTCSWLSRRTRISDFMLHMMTTGLGMCSSRLQRTLILKTVAKVQPCVGMLDLECDGFIVEIFQHFLKT